ncbi:MAG: Rieske 2Fe-2S domain-containing protein [Pseudomonadota bacterium]
MSMADPWPRALAEAWHPIAYAREIGARPVARMLMDRPVVVWRSADGLSVLEDRCPHRNVPLSGGRIDAGVLSCPYHGWEFGGDGQLLRVPGSSECPATAARAFPVIERAGLIWTSFATEPAPFPELPAAISDPTRDCFWWRVDSSQARIADAIENILDPMHSYFVHPGFVRASRKPIPMDLELRIDGQGCEARYTEARETMTWLQRFAEGDRVCSNNRYLAPSITEVEFVSTKGVTITITTVLSPEAKDRTRPYAHFAMRKGWMPGWIKRLALTMFLIPILKQDRAALRAQAQNVERFGETAYTMGPIDYFGPMIWRLLNGEPQPVETRHLRIVG